MTSSSRQWDTLISEALETTDPRLSNFRITRAHYFLSEALREAISTEAGANFHSWAVWGSRKAGVTIRQEDKDQASRDAMIVAGIVGLLVGVIVGWLCADWLNLTRWLSIAAWSLTGMATAAYSGYLLAGYTRTAASRLILEGNRIVLDDIGRATGHYLNYVAGSSTESFAKFLAGFREGRTEDGGQELLHRAFTHYERARVSLDAKEKHEATYFANCLAILHEHIRLQPYISRSLPFLIRKCVTERLMTYSVGEQQLSVHDDVPPLNDVDFPPTLESIDDNELREFLNGPDGWDRGRNSLQNTKASDWTRIRERMAYVVNLFRSRHLEDDVVASPYSVEQLNAIRDGQLPARPW